MRRGGRLELVQRNVRIEHIRSGKKQSKNRLVFLTVVCRRPTPPRAATRLLRAEGGSSPSISWLPAFERIAPLASGTLPGSGAGSGPARCGCFCRRRGREAGPGCQRLRPQRRRELPCRNAREIDWDLRRSREDERRRPLACWLLRRGGASS